MPPAANTIEREPAEEGFSLIEVLVAAGLLIGSIAALAFVFVFATRANADARHTTYATVLAMQKMEELRADFAPIHVVEAVDYADIRGTVLVGQSDPPQAVYERHWTVEPLSTPPVYPRSAVNVGEPWVVPAPGVMPMSMNACSAGTMNTSPLVSGWMLRSTAAPMPFIAGGGSPPLSRATTPVCLPVAAAAQQLHR